MRKKDINYIVGRGQHAVKGMEKRSIFVSQGDAYDKDQGPWSTGKGLRKRGESGTQRAGIGQDGQPELEAGRDCKKELTSTIQTAFKLCDSTFPSNCGCF